MDDDVGIPDYLAELLHPTPSGTAKLLAAWDGLAVETKIRLWTRLESTDHPPYLHALIRTRVLSDQNAFVRYLAARELDREDDETPSEVTHSKTANDPSELVRYAHLETEFGDIGGGLLSSPSSYFAIPQSARLARIRCLKEEGEEIAAIIVYGARELLPKGDVSEVELFEIAQEFTQSVYVRRRQHLAEHLPRDGYGEYLAGEGLRALWRCVLEVPEAVALPLIRSLPEAQGLATGIPQDVLDNFPPRLLQRLLWREDVELQAIRKPLALDATRKDAVNSAAAVNVQLTDAELGEMLIAPKELTEEEAKAEPTQDNVAGRLRLLERFAVCGGALEPVHLLVISDVLCALPMIGLHDPGEQGDLARIGYERALSRAEERGRSAEFDRVRVYRAAQLASDWGSEKVGTLPEPLRPLGVEPVPGNPWATLIRLQTDGGIRYDNAAKALRNHIWLYEIGEEPPDLFDND